MNPNKKQFVDQSLSPSMDWICYDTDPKIRFESSEVTFPLNDEDREKIAKMIAYIDASYHNLHKKYKIRAGIAIAGVQAHYLKKMAYIHLDDEDGLEHEYLIANPKIIYESYNKGFVHCGEGCLSVPHDHQGLVPRSNEIVVDAIDVFTEKPITIKAKGLLAICLQHEIDHLYGKLYYDRINLFNPMHREDDWHEI